MIQRKKECIEVVIIILRKRPWNGDIHIQSLGSSEAYAKKLFICSSRKRPWYGDIHIQSLGSSGAYAKKLRMS